METTEPGLKSFEELAESMIQPEDSDDETTDAPDIEENQTEDVSDSDDLEALDAEAEKAPEESEDEDEDEAEDEAVREQPETLTVKVDGEDVSVTLEELKQSYSGQQYIRKGMKEAAEIKKRYDAGFQAVQQQQQQLEQLVDVAMNGGFVPPTPPDIATLQSDPIGYMEQKAQFDIQAAEYNQFVQQYQYQQQALQQAEEAQKEAFREEQRQQLYAAIPELSDPVKSVEIQNRIREVAENEYGFTVDELRQLVDSRQARVLHDAMRYHELLKNTKKAAAAKAAKARPVAKAGAKTDQKRNNERKMLERLKKTGSDDAALSLMFQD